MFDYNQMNRTHLERLLSAHPKKALGRFPTPLEWHSGFLVKRDDLSGLAMGGNKVRKLEFFIGDALVQNAQVIVTLGSLQSNHCRLTAAAAARYNLACHLLLIGKPDGEKNLEGNHLLSSLLGAELFYIDPDSAREQIDDHLERLRNKGVDFYFIPGGGHNVTGILGYLAGALELTTQLERMELNPVRIFVTCGTGTTQAGLLLGLRLLGWSLPVTGVSVARSVERCRDEIWSVIQDFCDVYDIENPVVESDIDVDGRWIGSGYDNVPPERWRVIAEVARQDALLIDPIYTGRAMQSIIEYLNNSKEIVLFLHTGGVPELFVSKHKSKGFKV
jgi:1-aminocyclopropane-1-carboxylate deaminase/D-cysteine desulfhydrase-like pyridoxal-dependent ACC family enzyme